MATELRIKAKEDKHLIENLSLIKENREYNAILSGNLLLIESEGMVLIEYLSSDVRDTFDIVSEEEIYGLKTDFTTLSRYLKELAIKEWFDTNVEVGTVVNVIAIQDCFVANASGIKGAGNEYFRKGESYIGIDKGEIFMIQKRKGTVFYINKVADKFNFTAEEVLDEEIDYTLRKEIQFMEESDYRKKA